jgi:glucose-6-phosphate 1-dehydrogenase
MPTGTPTIFVLFGATGDLARRMVLPAFLELAQHDLMPESWLLVGNGRGDVSHDEFAERVHEAMTEFGPEGWEQRWDEFATHLRFAGGGFETSDPGSLLDVIADAKAEIGEDSRFIHYLAVPPSAFGGITDALGHHGLTEGARVVYEKPFGTSPASFRELDEAVHRVLDEEQVYRIDHFLGKEGTQNLHAVRFANGLFTGTWNREHIRAVQIDVPETLDIAERADFYDETGAFLDMIVTHLFQIAAEIAMEPPLSMGADDLQDARESVMRAFRPLAHEDVVLGQFEGYTDTDGIAADSTMDTFVAARLWIDTDRWRGVPFLLRTGKQLAESQEVVSLIFSAPDPSPLSPPPTGNVLRVDLAGAGAIELQLTVKEPGADFTLAAASVSLPLAHVEDADPLPPYVKLLSDVVEGDRSLFTRPDGLAAAWDAVAPILEDRPPVQPYERGSWGPDAAKAIAGDDGWLAGS